MTFFLTAFKFGKDDDAFNKKGGRKEGGLRRGWKGQEKKNKMVGGKKGNRGSIQAVLFVVQYSVG